MRWEHRRCVLRAAGPIGRRQDPIKRGEGRADAPVRTVRRSAVVLANETRAAGIWRLALEAAPWRVLGMTIRRESEGDDQRPKTGDGRFHRRLLSWQGVPSEKA